MGNITLGRYIPLNTFIHRLDPRTKILAMMLLIVGVFFNVGLTAYVVYALFFLLLLKVAHIRLISIYKSLKPMWFMFLFLFIVNIFLMQDTSSVLFTIPYTAIEVREGPVYQTLYIVLRLTLMIMITTLVTTSTKPLDLTYGLEYLFQPLKVFHFPAHEIAMTISIALRFIPTLLEETERIMKAQASRGVDLISGKFKEKILAIVSLIVPLFISSFQRSEELANAMESRGYNPTAPRTRYRQLNFQTRDLISIVGIIIVFGGMWFLSIYSLDSLWSFII